VVLCFYFIYEVHQPLFPHLNLLHSPFLLPQAPPHTHCTYFTVLCFVINFKGNVQRGFSVYPCCDPWVCSTSSIALSYPFPPIPHYSTAFNTYHYILYLGRCNTFQCFWLSYLSFPELHKHSSTIANMFYIYVCIWSCLFLCICLSFGSIFHIREKACSLVFLNLTYFTSHDVLQLHPFIFKPHVITPYG
jgi:hypothetical protein